MTTPLSLAIDTGGTVKFIVVCVVVGVLLGLARTYAPMPAPVWTVLLLFCVIALGLLGLRLLGITVY